MAEELAGRRIGFIGCGAMAQALAGGLAAAGIPRASLRGSDPAEAQRERFAQDLGIAVSADNAKVAAESDLLVLCVKPGAVAAVLAGLAGAGDLARPLWVSIAAGIRIETLAALLPSGARIVRAMPNTPALSGPVQPPCAPTTPPMPAIAPRRERSSRRSAPPGRPRERICSMP